MHYFIHSIDIHSMILRRIQFNMTRSVGVFDSRGLCASTGEYYLGEILIDDNDFFPEEHINKFPSDGIIFYQGAANLTFSNNRISTYNDNDPLAFLVNFNLDVYSCHPADNVLQTVTYRGNYMSFPIGSDTIVA